MLSRTGFELPAALTVTDICVSNGILLEFITPGGRITSPETEKVCSLVFEGIYEQLLTSHVTSAFFTPISVTTVICSGSISASVVFATPFVIELIGFGLPISFRVSACACSSMISSWAFAVYLFPFLSVTIAEMLQVPLATSLISQK